MRGTVTLEEETSWDAVVVGDWSYVYLSLPAATGSLGAGGAGPVGVKTVGNLEIALYAWGPQQVIYPQEDIHHKPREAATHHLDVRVYYH